jgi:molybdopterin-guanine dinucleotide biosynthesis protein A
MNTSASMSIEICDRRGIPLRLAGIVLGGGRSKRMGLPKADLPFGDETMLQRVVRLLSTVARPIVVVLAANQKLADQNLSAGNSGLLAGDVRIVRDQAPDRGPLEGLAAGLAALHDGADLAFAAACDTPLLEPAFVVELARRLAEAGEDLLAAAPFDGQFHHPLAAVYRAGILPAVQRQLAADQLRPSLLFEECPVLHVPVDELRTVDPELRTLWNLNRPEDYQAALKAAGL